MEMIGPVANGCIYPVLNVAGVFLKDKKKRRIWQLRNGKANGRLHDWHFKRTHTGVAT